MKILLPALVALLCSFAPAAADNAAVPPRYQAEVIGVARASSGDPAFDKRLKGELDTLVPRLKQLAPDAAILLEAYYPLGKPQGNDDRIRKAYALAEQAQLYLRNNHAVTAGIFISIWSGGATPENTPQLRLTAYPKTFFDN